MHLAEYEDQSDVDIACWALLDLDAEQQAEIERLRPPVPFWVLPTDRDAVARWALCWRIAAASAIVLGGQDDERTRRIFAWSAARGLHKSEIPTF